MGDILGNCLWFSGLGLSGKASPRDRGRQGVLVLEQTEAKMEFERAKPPPCWDGDPAGVRQEDQSQV